MILVRESIRKQSQEVFDQDDPDFLKFSEEVSDILKPYEPREIVEETVEVNNYHGGVVDIFPGCLLFRKEWIVLREEIDSMMESVFIKIEIFYNQTNFCYSINMKHATI